tara:strand:- start:3367 stop:4800 length:1434 start_codon:yes stop_codon:yes gene_type:complete
MSDNSEISKISSPMNSGRTSPRLDRLNQIAMQLYKNGIVKFGQFKLRSGAMSPIYFDLRRLITEPTLINDVVRQYTQLVDFVTDCGGFTRRVCGVAYTGIPIATVFSQQTGLPMIMKRKEAKDYGTRQLVEGDYKKGDHIVLLDDVITSGGSLLDTITILEKEGLIIDQIVVLIDRRPLKTGRPNKLFGKYPLRIVYTMENLLCRMKDQGVDIPIELLPKYDFSDRINLSTNQATKRLMSIIATKCTNLVVSADVTTTSELLTLLNIVGPEICMVKTHMDIIKDFEYDKVIPQMLDLAKKYNFMILEDRKFADIGNTLKLQFTKGIHRIAEWADFITVHALLGEGALNAFADVCRPDQGVLLLAELSNAGNLIDNDYTEQACLMAEKYPELVSGLICQRKLLHDGFLHFTPGVNLVKQGDKDDQQYKTPDRVIGELQSDIMIVGRGIYKKVNPGEAAQEYRIAGWNAYQKKLKEKTI